MAAKHKYVNTQVDDGNSSIVQPSDWNADHDMREAYRFISSNYTIDPDVDEYIEVSSGSPTITLTSAAASNTRGKKFRFMQAGTGVATINPPGAETINDYPTYELNTKWQFVDLYANGTNWRVVGGN